MKKKQEDTSESLIPCFVVNKTNEPVGETIGMDGKRIIIKNREVFYSISLSKLNKKFDKLVVDAVDWKEAKILGERWRKKSFVVRE
jgi:hypothetical protein